MTKEPTKLQTNILHLAQTRDLSEMTYREIAEYVGANHPYSVQQAVRRLIGKGLLIENKVSGGILAPDADSGTRPLLSIPILGKVSCGPALEMAEDHPSGFVSVSPSVAKIRKPDITYALIAAGGSMSSARINGKAVDDGDYVIVEKRQWGEAHDGDYVISRFNDTNNLKKLQIDESHRRVILLSESQEEHPPIIISEDDMDYYAIEGIAVDVVKGLPG